RTFSRPAASAAAEKAAATMGQVSQLTPEVDPNEPPELPRDFREYEPIQPRGTDWREIGRKIWAPFAAIGAFIAKFGVGILKFKFLFGLFISFGAYLWYGGLAFAIGLVGLIFVHEMGHWLEAKRQGLPVSAPLLIPLLALVLYRPNGILVLILVFAAMELWQRWQARRFGGTGSYYSVLPWQRLTAAVSYFGLAALLVLGMHETHVPHHF